MINKISGRAKRNAAVGYGFESRVSFNHDGMEIARVKPRKKWLPVWHFIFFVYIGLLIRLISMADMGPAAFENRMAELENGTIIERVTARVMYMDPVSRAIAIDIRRGLKDIRSL